jgi:small neutral amino acid transporter SnatA (MarC family)
VDAFVRAVLLFLVLLNPFIMAVYLLPLLRKMTLPSFGRTLRNGAVIAGMVFLLFAIAGDAVFQDVLQVRFAAFMIFGGLVFLLIGVQYVTQGSPAIERLAGGPAAGAGTIAMPFMVGPGTISASILAGARLCPALAAAAIASALTLTVLGVLALKAVHDWVHARHESYVERYVDVAGRISALVLGTVAVEMILQGIDLWLAGPAPV